MNLTVAFKAWLREKCNVAATATDGEYKKAAADAIVNGILSSEKLAELQTKSAADQNPLEMLTGVLQQMSKRLDSLEAGTTNKEVAVGKTKLSDEEHEDNVGDNLINTVVDGPAATTGQSWTGVSNGGKGDHDTITKTADAVFAAMANRFGNGSGMQRQQPAAVSDKLNPVKLFTMSDDERAASSGVRVKSAAESYSTMTKAACYPTDCKHAHLRGIPVQMPGTGREINEPSQLAKAVTGAWFKFAAQSAFRTKGANVPSEFRMTEHDNALVQYALHEMPFTGLVNWNEKDACGKYELKGDRKMTDFEIKAVLDDSTSGGIIAAPLVFDEAIILFPLLWGEVFPLVSIVNMTRGRRVEGFSMQNPTIQSGIADGTEIALFDTSSFIAAFDTTIFTAVGAMEIGKDFEEDSPLNMGETIVQRYGEQMLVWLDRVIVAGNGLTEPLGVANSSGTVSITTDNSTSGPPTLSDYEQMLFGVKKQYRQPQDRARCVYVTCEVSYRRSRGMKVDPHAVGSTIDERRLLGLDHENYMTLGHPHKINESLTNSQGLFFNARRYRMYRRLGMQVAIEEGGKELVRRNSRLIVVRARFGGQLEDGNAASYASSMQS